MLSLIGSALTALAGGGLLTGAVMGFSELRVRAAQRRALRRADEREPHEIESLAISNWRSMLEISTSNTRDLVTTNNQLRERIAELEKTVVQLRAELVRKDDEMGELYRQLGRLNTRLGRMENAEHGPEGGEYGAG